MTQISRRGTVLAAVAAGLLIAAPGMAAAQQDRQGNRESQQDDRERIIGVVTRVEKTDDGVTLTINTAAEWRDYVRTANEKKPGTDEPDPSITTKGQPESPDSTATVVLASEARVIKRPTPVAGEGTNDSAVTREAQGQRRRGERIDASELKEGQFVTAICRKDADKNMADRVIVMVPVEEDDEDEESDEG